MSVNGIHGAALPATPANTAADIGAAAARSRTEGKADITTSRSNEASESKPAPLRFPWLSRLSEQLSAAAKKPATFSAPIIGDNLDKQA